MTSSPVANILSSTPHAPAGRVGARQHEATANPFQQMLTEKIARNESRDDSQVERKEINTPAAATEKPATPAADKANKNQADSGEADSSESDATSLSPELAAMINGLIQRHEDSAPKGDADGDPLALLGKGLGKQDGETQDAELGLTAAKHNAQLDLTATKHNAQPDLTAAKHNTQPDLTAAKHNTQPDLTAAKHNSDLDLNMQPELGRLASPDAGADEASATGFSSTLQQLAPTAQVAGARNAQGLPTHQIIPKVGASGWDQAVAQRVTWMVRGAEQSASLTLNPPELGPLQVVLNVSNSQANATFIAAHAEVRQALEAALPKLREMLGDVGIQLDQASVNQGTPQQQGDFAHSAGQGSRSRSNDLGGADSLAAEEPAAARRITSSGQGLVDTFV